MKDFIKHLVKDHNAEFGMREFTYSFHQFKLLRMALELNDNRIFEGLRTFGEDVELTLDDVLIGWGPMAEQIISGKHPWLAP